MTISLPAGWAVAGLSADVDGMAVIEDCPPVVAGADGGWLYPPHAVSMPAEAGRRKLASSGGSGTSRPYRCRPQICSPSLTKHLLDGDDSTFTGKVRPAKAAVCPAADTPTRGRAAAAADHYGADAT